jgi:FHS family L-fucose permease-like MFS transporter
LIQPESIPPTTKPYGSADVSRPNYGPAMAVLSTAFFMWGFVTVLNDILVPHLKGVFDLNYTQTMLIQFAFFSAYFLMSGPSAKVVALIGYKRSMVAGLLVMATGALLFIPAASVLSYGAFLGGLLVLASGITLVQVAANPYVAAMGSPETASSRLTLAQALNSLGTTVGPAIGGFLILRAATHTPAELRAMAPDQLQAWRLAEAASVKMPYVGIALLLAAVAFAIARFHFPPLEIEPHHEDLSGLGSVWRYRNLAFGAGAIFVYVGAEVSIGSFLVSYFIQPDIAGLTAPVAARYVSFYWGGAMVGRFLGVGLLRRFRPGPAVGSAAIVAALLVVTSILTSGWTAAIAILAVGLFNSIMFPTIFTLGIAELGKLTSRGSGVMIAAVVGGALIPLAEGALADRIGLQLAFILPVVCYLYIVFYGFVGSRPGRFDSV